MNDQNELDSPRLRDILGLAPDGRRKFFWSGQDRKADTDELVKAIAATGELFNRQGAIVRLSPRGELIGVNMASFREFIDQHICGVKVVPGGNGRQWQLEFFAYQFPQAARYDARISGPQPPADTSEPDATVLDQIYRHELLQRIPKVK